jgi:integrase
VPITYRLLYGFLAREGARYSEAARLTWGNLDLKRGAITVDVNKTDDPRVWALSPASQRRSPPIAPTAREAMRWFSPAPSRTRPP